MMTAPQCLRDDSPLDCGHPRECLTGDDGYEECGWCSDVAMLQGSIVSLAQQLKKNAYILKPGTHDLRAHTIGYFVMEAGATANFDTVRVANARTITRLGAKGAKT